MALIRGKRALLPVAAGCALLALAACRRRGNDYPPELVENFLRACGGRASEQACRCSLERVQERYTVEQYRALEARIGATQQVPPELLAVIDACR